MLKFVFGMFAALTLSWFVAAQQAPNQPLPPNHPEVQPQLPPNHPQLPQLPTGHPDIGQGGDAGPVLKTPPPAKPEDVASIDAIVKAYYDTVSGERGKPRDWDRLRSLMVPDARLVTTRPLDNANMPMIFNIDQFIEVNGTYFERGGYFEREIHRQIDQFGTIAQVFSTYESRRDLREEQPYSRGINSIQLLNDGMRWWIVNIMWDYERADTNPLPAKYGGAAALSPSDH
jgi:hypothetical protein